MYPRSVGILVHLKCVFYEKSSVRRWYCRYALFLWTSMTRSPIAWHSIPSSFVEYTVQRSSRPVGSLFEVPKICFEWSSFVLHVGVCVVEHN